MTQITQEQRETLEAAGWTEEDVTGFAQTVATFRDGLPPRQRDAFTAILATAGAAANGDDTQGYRSLAGGWSAPPGLSGPFVRTPPTVGQPPTTSNLVVIAIIAVLMPLLVPAVQ